MNKNALALARQMRAMMLRYNASWYRDGLYHSAQIAARARKLTQINAYLRDLSASGPKNVDDRAFLSELLEAIAAGFDVRPMLRLDKRNVGYRKKNLGREIAAEVLRYMEEGEPPQAAKAAVAKILTKDPDAVRKDYERHAPTIRKLQQDQRKRQKREDKK
jgi:hypothetical protein